MPWKTFVIFTILKIYLTFQLAYCSPSFQDTQVIETGLSDFHKMNITVLKMFFSKQKHETFFFRNYKKFDNSAFREAPNRITEIWFKQCRTWYISRNFRFSPKCICTFKRKNIPEQIMQVLWQRNFETLLCKEQDLETSTLNKVLKQPRLHIISKEMSQHFNEIKKILFWKSRCEIC